MAAPQDVSIFLNNALKPNHYQRNWIPEPALPESIREMPDQCRHLTVWTIPPSTILRRPGNGHDSEHTVLYTFTLTPGCGHSRHAAIDASAVLRMAALRCSRGPRRTRGVARMPRAGGAGWMALSARKRRSAVSRGGRDRAGDVLAWRPWGLFTRIQPAPSSGCGSAGLDGGKMDETCAPAR